MGRSRPISAATSAQVATAVAEPFTATEVKAALDLMGRGKSSGLALFSADLLR